MSTEMITTPAAVADVATDVQLVAKDPEQMKLAQQQLGAWLRAKATICKRDADDLDEAERIAAAGNLRHDALSRQCRIARNRQHYYEKCAAATEAGYCLVPNMPIDAFAIRTEKKNPRGKETDRTSTFPQQSESPPAGAGQWRGALARYKHRQQFKKDDKGNAVLDYRQQPVMQDLYRPSSFDEVEFPVSIVKPLILSQVTDAMRQQVFDELGLVSTEVRKGDPIVVGRIYDRTAPAVMVRTRHDWIQQRTRFMTFLVAWWIDTRDL